MKDQSLFLNSRCDSNLDRAVAVNNDGNGATDFVVQVTLALSELDFDFVECSVQVLEHM